MSSHREENVDIESKFNRLFPALNKIADKYKLPVIFSVHPRTRKKLDERGFQMSKYIREEKPFGFFEYIKLQENAFCVLSDSGTLTEESSILDFPAVLIRTSTERQEGVIHEVRSQIVSITHSKNALGIFLFAGCFASAFLLKYLIKWKWPFILTFLLNLLIAFVSGCYTAVVPVFLLAVILIISWVVQLIKNPKKKWLGYGISLVVITALVIVLVCVYTPSIRTQSGVWSRLYNRLSSLGTNEVSSRTNLWTTGLSVLNGPFVFFGKPDQVANVEIGIAQLILPGNDLSPEDFHSAFLSFYSSHGLVGFVVYLALHAWVFAQLIKVHRKNPTLSVYLLILFVGAILFSMPETYTLFISMSASTFPISLLFICDIDFFKNDSSFMTAPLPLPNSSASRGAN